MEKINIRIKKSYYELEFNFDNYTEAVEFAKSAMQHADFDCTVTLKQVFETTEDTEEEAAEE